MVTTDIFRLVPWAEIFLTPANVGNAIDGSSCENTSRNASLLELPCLIERPCVKPALQMQAAGCFFRLIKSLKAPTATHALSALAFAT